MLDIYRNYLLNIRNSLIQCGVNIPVESVDEYFDICKLQQELDDILYYYNILANSNSTDKLENFFIRFSVPLRKRIGDESYKEFLEFWEDYKKMSSSYAVYQSLCVKLQELNKELASGGGYNVDSSVTTEDKQEKVSKENIKAEIDRQREDIFKMYYEPRESEKEVKKKEEIKKNRVSLFEDLFGDSSSSNESTKETSTDGNSNTEDSNTEEVSSGVDLDEEDTEEVSSGIDLDEEDTITDSLDDEEDTANDSLDDLSDEDAESIFSGILHGSESSEGDSKDVELVSHGNYLEDMLEEESEESEEDEDNGITYEDEDESSNWMSDEDEEYDEDEEEYDENDNVSYVDEDDASWGISSEDEYEEDEDNGITYEDEEESGNWLSDEEDEEYEDDEDEDDGVTYEDEDSSSWNMSDEDDYDEDDELPNISEGNDEEVQSQAVNEILNTDESKKEPEKDILDTLQTETSKFVNRGYRTIKNLEKRLKGV